MELYSIFRTLMLNLLYSDMYCNIDALAECERDTERGKFLEVLMRV